MSAPRKKPLTDSPEDFKHDLEHGEDSAERAYRLALRYFRGKGTKRKPDEAFVYMSAAAEAGYMPAQFFLGQMYEKGWAPEKNFEKALEWYGKAEEKNSSRARYRMTLIKFRGFSHTPEEAKEIFQSFHRLANRGHMNAMLMVGKCYYNGFGVDKDVRSALNYYKQAAKKGSGKGAFNAYLIYREGSQEGSSPITANLPEAFKFLRLAIESKSMVGIALCELGDKYHFAEDGYERDYKRAARCYQDALEKHRYANAAFLLANLYEAHPELVPKDKEAGAEIERLYALAAGVNTVSAQLRLARYYERTNPILALKWYKKAAESSKEPIVWHEYANVLQRYRGKTDSEIERWLKKAASKNYLPAIEDLSILRSTSLSQKIKFCKQAIAAGSLKAYVTMGLLHEGRGNFLEAAKCFRVVVTKGIPGSTEVIQAINRLKNMNRSSDVPVAFHVLVALVELVGEDPAYKRELNQLAEGKYVTRTLFNRSAIIISPARQRAFLEQYNAEPPDAQGFISSYLTSPAMLTKHLEQYRLERKEELRQRQLAIALILTEPNIGIAFGLLGIIFAYDAISTEAKIETISLDSLTENIATLRQHLTHGLYVWLREKSPNVPPPTSEEKFFDSTFPGETGTSALGAVFVETQITTSLDDARFVDRALKSFHVPEADPNKKLQQIVQTLQTIAQESRERKTSHSGLAEVLEHAIKASIPQWTLDSLILRDRPAPRSLSTR